MPNMPPVKFTLFSGRKKPKDNFQLTQLGKTKVEEWHVSGPRGEVLMAIESVGPCSISEIASEAKMSLPQTKQFVSQLMSQGWVRRVSSEE